MRALDMATVLQAVFFVSTSIIAETVTLTKTSNACYSSGGDCGFHFLSCDHGLVVSLRTMDYGFKEPAVHETKECEQVLTNCAVLGSRKECCEYDARTDCLKTYSYEHLNHAKQICDGKVKCSFHATYVNGGCQNPPTVYNDVSSYSVITYVCVNATGHPATASWTTQRPGNQHTQAPTNEIVSCDGCTTSSHDMEKEARERQREHDENALQLIVGVSVGVGSGVIALIIIAVVCWIRMRRKPPAPPSTVRTGTAGGTTATRSSRTHTTTSSMPSSLYSSSLYSDTLPSSHPDSLYSMPADVSNADSSVGRHSRFRNYGYDDEDDSVTVSANPPSAVDFGQSPELPERGPRSYEPRASASGRDAVPRSNVRNENRGGIFSMFSLQLNDGRSGHSPANVSPSVQNPHITAEDAEVSPAYQTVGTHQRTSAGYENDVSPTRNGQSDHGRSRRSRRHQQPNGQPRDNVLPPNHRTSSSSRGRSQEQDYDFEDGRGDVLPQDPFPAYAVPSKMRPRPDQTEMRGSSQGYNPPFNTWSGTTQRQTNGGRARQDELGTSHKIDPSYPDRRHTQRQSDNQHASPSFDSYAASAERRREGYLRRNNETVDVIL